MSRNVSMSVVALGAMSALFLSACATETPIGIDTCALQCGAFNNSDSNFNCSTLLRLSPWFWNDACEINGISLSLLMSGSSHMNGLELSGGFNQSARVNGLQMSLLYNETDTMNGLQVAAINDAASANGVQFALYNSTREQGNVFQLGLFNQSNSSENFQIGLLNHNGHFWFPIINMNMHSLRWDAHPERDDVKNISCKGSTPQVDCSKVEIPLCDSSVKEMTQPEEKPAPESAPVLDPEPTPAPTPAPAPVDDNGTFENF